MSNRNFTIILSAETRRKIEDYAAHLNNGGQRGSHLAQHLTELKIDGPSLLDALLKTKRPQIFAESHISGDGSDWSQKELEILGNISIGMDVTIYDNGAHQKPKIHSSPFLGHLVYTPGALLRNDRGFTPADWERVTVDGEFDPLQYYALYKDRLRPVFSYINETSMAREKPAFITVPGIGCGQFAGPFRGQMGSLFQAALTRLLEEYGEEFPAIKAVYYDPYNECDNQDKYINGIQFLVRPLTADNAGKSQLCAPSFLMQSHAGAFDECELYSLVAWDPVSWPGNDFYLGERVTDDGVKAAATDTMYRMTGIKGEYSAKANKYLPPSPFENWKKVTEAKGVILDSSVGVFVA
jgi:hypothetical protein